MAICAEPGCGLIAPNPYEYCPTHLEIRHRLSCETVARLSVMHLLESSADEVDQVKSISELPAFDSLKDVELGLMFQELAGVEFESDNSLGECGVPEIAIRLQQTLAGQQRFLMEPRLDVAQAHKRAIQKKENVKHQIRTIVNSDLFRDYVTHLGYSDSMLHDTLSVFVGGYWIEHVFTIPKLERGKLEYVHVFVLTTYGLVHILLKRHELQVQSWPAADVALKYTLEHSNGSTSKIVVEFMLGTETKGFEFSDVAGIGGALRFYEKWMQRRNS
jgi:hypothetical protein